MSLEDKIDIENQYDMVRESVITEIDTFEKNADTLPEARDIEMLSKIQAIWVLSGNDFTNIQRLAFAEEWLSRYSDILPDEAQPILIYNGTKDQNDELSVKADRIYFAPGDNTRTLDQVKNFSFPPDLDIKNSYLGVLTNASHLPRTLRFMNNFQYIFKGIKIVALPVSDTVPDNKSSVVDMEAKGVLDYIKRGSADSIPYPYILINK
jgi:hypothetical protein